MEVLRHKTSFRAAEEFIREHPEEISEKEAFEKYTKSVTKGMLKVMSKMGISTYQSYSGAQIFDAVGLSSNLVDKYFCGTSSKVEGINLEEIQITSIQLSNV